MKIFKNEEKFKKISEILNLDIKFMDPNYEPIFKTEYVFLEKENKWYIEPYNHLKYDCEGGTDYYPKYYKQYDSLWLFKKNDDFVTRQNICMLNSLSDKDLILNALNCKKRLLILEQDKLSALKYVHESLKERLNQIYTSKDTYYQDLAYSSLFAAAFIPLMPIATPALGLFAYLMTDTKKDKIKSYLHSIGYVENFIKEIELKIDSELSIKVSEHVLLHVFSGDDWREKLDIYNKKSAVLQEFNRYAQ